MESIGNKEILDNYKIGFLCSRRVPSSIILKTYDWAIAQREDGKCVISGFHSKIEKDVLHYLLKGNQPIIVVLARGLYKRMPELMAREIDKGRMLIITPFAGQVRRVSENETYKRNELIIKMSNEIFIPYAAPDGQIANLVNKLCPEDYRKIHFIS